MQGKAIVITGLGVISSIGFGKEKFFANLCNGQDGTEMIKSTSLDGFKRKYACEVKEDLAELKDKNINNRALQMALMAVDEAVKDAKLTKVEAREKIALSLGTTNSGALEFEKWYCAEKDKHEKETAKSILEQYPLHHVAESISSTMNFKGLSNTAMTACASGATAIVTACQWLQAGRAEIVVCGGVDVFKPSTHLQLSQLRVIAPDATKPFDKNRHGFLLGEGAGILVLETEESARRRNAKIYGSILGYGMSCDAHDVSNPDTNGLILAVKRAIKMAGISYEDVSMIKAQGTGSAHGDKAEIKAMNELFGKCKDIEMTSFKGALGHTTGAAGGIEAVAAVLSIVNQQIAPTIHTTECDPACEIDIVLQKFKKREIKTVLANYFGFGGNNVSLIFGGEAI